MALDLQEALHNPIMFFEDVLRIKPTDQQLELLETILVDLYDPTPGWEALRRLVVSSGAGIGKTTSLTGLALWFGLRSPNTAVYITAPTMRQVQEVFFSELRRTIGRAHPHIADITTVTSRVCRFYKNPLWHVTGVSAAKSENMQGLHQDKMVFLIDECSGIQRPILEAILATLTNAESYLVATGNPNTRDCEFFQYFYGPNRSDWHKLFFSSEDSPIADKKNIARLERQFGRDSDEFRVRVLGQFPKSDSTSIIDHQDLYDASQRPDPWQNPEGHNHRYSIGIDIAGMGADESVVVARRAGHVAAMQVFSKKEPEAVIQAAFALQYKLQWPNDQTVYVFDSTGMGHGRKEIFHRNHKNVHMFTFNARARRSKQFANKITEAWFELRNQLKAQAIKIPYDDKTWTQLTSRQFEFHGDALRVEKKEAWRKRTNNKGSPDRADALVMAFYPHTKLNLITPNRENQDTLNMPHSHAMPNDPYDRQGRVKPRKRIRINNR